MPKNINGTSVKIMPDIVYFFFDNKIDIRHDNDKSRIPIDKPKGTSTEIRVLK